MNDFIFFMIVGTVMAIATIPILFFIYVKFRNTVERRNIKRMLKKGQFLVTIDPRDYNVKAWQNQKYGNIDVEENSKYLSKLNEKIFKKSIESTDDNFLIRVGDYITEARRIGHTDEKIKEEFRKKSYTEELINKAFNEYGDK